MHIIREIIEIDQTDPVPLIEIRQNSEELKAFLSLHDLMLVERILIVSFVEAQCDHFGMCQYCRSSSRVFESITYTIFTHDCITAEIRDAGKSGVRILFFLTIDAAISTHYYVHAVANCSLIH